MKSIQTHLLRLESEAIEIMREVVPEVENLAVAEERDVKGLYAKARSGRLKNFIGIYSPYEAPETPEIHIDTTAISIEDAAEQIVNQLLGEL